MGIADFNCPIILGIEAVLAVIYLLLIMKALWVEHVSRSNGITPFIPCILEQYSPAPVFTFFAFVVILQLIFAFYLMPETKGESLENLSAKLIKQTEENR